LAIFGRFYAALDWAYVKRLRPDCTLYNQVKITETSFLSLILMSAQSHLRPTFFLFILEKGWPQG
jgi:hypothetical protein